MRIKDKIYNILDGTHHHFRCFLPEKISPFSSTVLKLFYSGVKLEENQTTVINDIPKDAIPVFVSKFKSNFDYLFSYSYFKNTQMPVPEIGFDYEIILWQPVSRIFKIVLAKFDFFFRHFSLLNPYTSGYLGQELLAGRCGFLSLVEKGGVYRRFVKAQTDPVQYLIEFQQSIDRPIYFIPQ